MPEKEVASIPVIGYTNDVKVYQEDDTVVLNIPSFDSGEDVRFEVILYANEVDQVIDALVEAKTLAESALEDEEEEPPEAEVSNTRVEVKPLLPAYVTITNRTNGVLEDEIEGYIESEVPVIIEYTKEDGEEVVRVVSPYEIETVKDGYPFNRPKYVRGWDHKREDFRTFRLARIQAIGPAATEFIGSMSNPI